MGLWIDKRSAKQFADFERNFINEFIFTLNKVTSKFEIFDLKGSSLWEGIGAVRFQKFHHGPVSVFCLMEEPRFGVDICKRRTIQSVRSINCDITSK
jgi:hypothetical protein